MPLHDIYATGLFLCREGGLAYAMTTRPNLNGAFLGSVILFTELPCGQTNNCVLDELSERFRHGR